MEFESFDEIPDKFFFRNNNNDNIDNDDYDEEFSIEVPRVGSSDLTQEDGQNQNEGEDNVNKEDATLKNKRKFFDNKPEMPHLVKRQRAKLKKLYAKMRDKVDTIQFIIGQLPPQLRNCLSFTYSKSNIETSPDGVVIKTIEGDLAIIDEWNRNIEDEVKRKGNLKSSRRENHQVRRMEDISQGTFPFPVPCINEIDDDPFPSNVKWVEKCFLNGIEENVDPSFTIPGCECVPTCADSSKCLCCEEMAFGSSAYDANRVLQLAPGYLVYECNSNCACRDSCRNRVVQRGPQYPVEIYKTEKKGWAVRAQVDIPKGRFVCEYIGEIITSEEAEKRGEYYDAVKCSYLYDLDMEEKERCLTIDANTYGNVSRFINHSCSPNLQNYQVFIEDLDKRKPHVAFFTNQDVKAGEELTFDYKYEKVSKNKASIPCYCGAKNCKRILT